MIGVIQIINGGKMGNYASYEKYIVSKVEKITHTVRIKLNEPAGSVMKTLKNVPPDATVTMVVDDSELEGYGEIVFEETKNTE